MADAGLIEHVLRSCCRRVLSVNEIVNLFVKIESQQGIKPGFPPMPSTTLAPSGIH